MNGETGAAARVTIDPERCLGSGTCVAVAPALFDMSDAGTAQPLQAVVERDAKLVDAVSRCPTGAIEVSPA
jgi:ferredoxin